LIIFYGIKETLEWSLFLFPISHYRMILLLQSLASISELLPIALDSVASPARRPKVPIPFMCRYCDQPDNRILSKSWVVALRVTCGSELLQGRSCRARPPTYEDAHLHLWLVENKSNPHAIKSRSVNHWLPRHYSIQDLSLGHTFWGILWE
jgi:hypothetical protein